jgi:hypothetical protein
MITSLMTTQGQVALWKLYPKYDTIYKPEGAYYIVTHNDGCQTSTLWTLTDFQEICNINGKMYKIQDGVAVYTEQNNDLIRGFIHNTGATVKLGGQDKYYVDPQYPYFSNEHLVVQDQSKHYRYLFKTGSSSKYHYKKAYPFFNGYSSCEYYLDQINNKNPQYGLLNSEMRFVQFRYRKTLYTNKDIDFVSSVNDEHIAILIAKKRVFLFHSETNTLTPLYSRSNDSNDRNQTKLSDVLSNSLIKKDNQCGLIVTCGRNDTVNIIFDKYMRTKYIKYTDTIIYYTKHETSPQSILSTIEINKGEGGCGISYGNHEMLAPQFEEASSCYGNLVIVRKNGKYGVLQILPERRFNAQFYEYNNTAIPFVHKELKTTIQIDIPQEIPGDSAHILFTTLPNCKIDRSSRRVNSSQTTNWIQYDCILDIPPALFKQETAELEIPYQILYTGIISPIQYLKKRATIRKYWSANVDNEKMYDGDSLSFGLNLEYSDPLTRDAKYGVSVTVLPKETCTIDTFTFTKYRCTAHQVKRGKNKFKIIIAEDGFPPTIIPHTIDYEPPEPQTSEVPEVIDDNSIPHNVIEPKSEVKKPQSDTGKQTKQNKPDPPTKQLPNF